MWPSISGVALRIRSIRVATLGSIGWAEAAEAQGFKFDRHAARNELQAATFGKRRRATARLLLSPTGAMAIEVRSD